MSCCIFLVPLRGVRKYQYDKKESYVPIRMKVVPCFSTNSLLTHTIKSYMFWLPRMTQGKEFYRLSHHDHCLRKDNDILLFKIISISIRYGVFHIWSSQNLSWKYHTLKTDNHNVVQFLSCVLSYGNKLLFFTVSFTNDILI